MSSSLTLKFIPTFIELLPILSAKYQVLGLQDLANKTTRHSVKFVLKNKNFQYKNGTFLGYT